MFKDLIRNQPFIFVARSTKSNTILLTHGIESFSCFNKTYRLVVIFHESDHCLSLFWLNIRLMVTLSDKLITPAIKSKNMHNQPFRQISTNCDTSVSPRDSRRREIPGKLAVPGNFYSREFAPGIPGIIIKIKRYHEMIWKPYYSQKHMF